MAGLMFVDDILGAVSLIYMAFESILGPVVANALVFIIGIYFFAIFYEFFFERLSKREIFTVEMRDAPITYSYADFSFNQIFRFLLKNVLVFPLMASVLTAFTTIFLIFLSKDQSVQNIASISFAVVVVVRILAYTHEKLAKEVAKLLPFSLLTIVLTNPTTFAQSDLIARGNELLASAGSLIPLLLAFIAIEIIIQLVMQMRKISMPQEEEEQGADAPIRKRARRAKAAEDEE
ncbi:hypothetical protein COU37_04475 [Candidatus Micrarchaeota archaeon CG10_big_fil_rev_8_21_14_0_10_45_29]|nr:MAG: hypothetical protein COU37_04475 [Candidatus Micrarchaeota archaeon CG10_big_fil_rev_8_21_14_0_10_45_29]